MAVGDDATRKGFPLVPDSGEEGRVRWGAREINRTRDFVAQAMDALPTSRAAFREKSGITSGPGFPDNSWGQDGDFYARYY